MSAGCDLSSNITDLVTELTKLNINVHNFNYNYLIVWSSVIELQVI